MQWITYESTVTSDTINCPCVKNSVRSNTQPEESDSDDRSLSAHHWTGHPAGPRHLPAPTGRGVVRRLPGPARRRRRLRGPGWTETATREMHRNVPFGSRQTRPTDCTATIRLRPRRNIEAARYRRSISDPTALEHAHAAKGCLLVTDLFWSFEVECLVIRSSEASEVLSLSLWV